MKRIKFILSCLNRVILVATQFHMACRLHKKVTSRPPNFSGNLNAINSAEQTLTSDEMKEYDHLLPLQGVSKCSNTAIARAVCWLRAKKIPY